MSTGRSGLALFLLGLVLSCVAIGIVIALILLIIALGLSLLAVIAAIAITFFAGFSFGYLTVRLLEISSRDTAKNILIAVITPVALACFTFILIFALHSHRIIAGAFTIFFIGFSYKVIKDKLRR